MGSARPVVRGGGALATVDAPRRRRGARIVRRSRRADLAGACRAGAGGRTIASASFFPSPSKSPDDRHRASAPRVARPAPSPSTFHARRVAQERRARARHGSTRAASVTETAPALPPSRAPASARASSTEYGDVRVIVLACRDRTPRRSRRALAAERTRGPRYKRMDARARRRSRGSAHGPQRSRLTMDNARAAWDLSARASTLVRGRRVWRAPPSRDPLVRRPCSASRDRRRARARGRRGARSRRRARCGTRRRGRATRADAIAAGLRPRATTKPSGSFALGSRGTTTRARARSREPTRASRRGSRGDAARARRGRLRAVRELERVRRSSALSSDARSHRRVSCANAESFPPGPRARRGLGARGGGLRASPRPAARRRGAPPSRPGGSSGRRVIAQKAARDLVALALRERRSPGRRGRRSPRGPTRGSRGCERDVRRRRSGAARRSMDFGSIALLARIVLPRRVRGPARGGAWRPGVRAALARHGSSLSRSPLTWRLAVRGSRSGYEAGTSQAVPLLRFRAPGPSLLVGAAWGAPAGRRPSREGRARCGSARPARWAPRSWCSEPSTSGFLEGMGPHGAS